MQKVIQKLAVLYLVIWSISPPLEIDLIYRLLALGCAGLWFLFSLGRGLEVEHIHLWAAFFMAMVILIIFIQKWSVSNFIKQIPIYILVVCFIMNCFYRQGRWGELKEIVPIVMALLIIFNWNTARALLEDPTIARRLVRADESVYHYLRQGIGGYSLIYPQVCISPALFAWTVHAFKRNKVFFLLGCGWAVSYTMCIFNAGYSIAIFTTIVGIIMLFAYRGKGIWKAILISGSIFAGVLLAIIYLDGFRNYLLYTFDGTAVATKINDLVATSSSGAAEGSIQARLIAYQASLEMMWEYPVIGSLWRGSGGGHSAVLDMLAKYGIWGGAIYMSMLYYVPTDYKKTVPNPYINRISNAVLVVMLFVTLLDSVTYSFMCMVLLVLPLLYEDIMMWKGIERCESCGP